jgi:hypothetical protein
MLAGVGVLLGLVGVVGIVFGLLQKRKSGKIGAIPFHPPSRIMQMGQSAADAKGMVSTEGQAVLSNTPLIAPMSGKPCIAYEIEIVQEYEYYEQTDQGTQTRTKSETSLKEFKGSIFQLSDGQGGVFVDAQKMPDASMEQSFRHRMDIGMMIPGQLQFGQGVFNTPLLSTEGPVKAFIGIERIIEPAPKMFVMGQLAQGPMGLAIGEPKGMLSGKMMIAPKSRDALLGAASRNAKIGLIAGAAMIGVGGIMGVVGALTGGDSDSSSSNQAAAAQPAIDPNAAAAQAAAQAAATQAAAQAAAQPAQPAFVPGVLPAGAPNPRSATCRRAMLCCLAYNQVQPSACYALANVADVACRANINAYKRMLQQQNSPHLSACE